VDIDRILQQQDGVISRAQVLAQGGGDADIRRMIRRREWARLLPGVYVDHTGAPTWRQRAHAAVLYAGPGAALDRESAIRADAGPGWRGCPDEAPVRVAVTLDRSVVELADVRVRRVSGLQGKVRWNLSPPRLRTEEAVLDLASGLSDHHALIEALAAPVRARCTTAQRLLDALEMRKRVARRALMADVLRDIRDGSCSVLEQGYLHRVEGAHGLPPGERQVHAAVELPGKRSIYRDVDYPAFGIVVELDGRVAHDSSEQRDADLDRDLESAGELLTVRLGFGQVFGRPCRTAGRLARVLVRRGWTSTPVPCGDDCTVGRAFAA
jgi:hypothetical protein